MKDVFEQSGERIIITAKTDINHNGRLKLAAGDINIQ